MLKLNPCSKPFEAPSPLYLTELLCLYGRAETGHLNWNLWHHSFSVGTERCIFNEGQAEAWCSSEHVARSGMLCWREPSLCPREMALCGEKGVGLRNGALFEMHSRWPATWWGRQTVNPSNPSVHCSFLECRLLLLITRPSWVKQFSI